MTIPDPGLDDQQGWRQLFRIGGWIILALGVVLTAIAFIDFFSAFGGFRAPQNFWMAFIGLPLIAVGSWMLKAGYLGPASSMSRERSRRHSATRWGSSVSARGSWSAPRVADGTRPMRSSATTAEPRCVERAPLAGPTTRPMRSSATTAESR